MTVDIRPAEKADVDALARFWHENMNSRVPLERWRSVASAPWYTQPPSHGWIAVDNGRIVGAMALVHSTRAIDGRIEKLCNIGSLYVLREYRGRGIARAIARDCSSDDSITYFGIDAAPQTRAVLEPPEAGYRVLDRERYVWTPRREGKKGDGGFFLRKMPPSPFFPDDWPPAEQHILEHHLPLGMVPVSAISASSECRLLLWIRNKSSPTLYYEVLYASDYEAFGNLGQQIADHLTPPGTGVLAVDARFYDRPPPGAEVEPLKQARHYKSTRLAPHQIDLLYSEVPLLGLKIS